MENLSLASNVIITGLVVVFSALLVLSLLISLFVKVFNGGKNKPDNSVSADNQAEGSDTTSYSEAATTADSDNELIAVLTAAIMASGMTRPDSKIRVTSYRRVPVTSPVWNVAGRTEVISGRL